MQVVFLEKGADLDALSSAYGITLLYPETRILLPDNVSETVKVVLKRFKEKFKEKIVDKNSLKKIEKIFIVDSHNIEHVLKKLSSYLEDKISIEIFDHHQILEKDYLPKEAAIHIKLYGSATTVVVEEIVKRNIPVDKDDATILALGIYEDTGSFTYKITTPEDLHFTAFLLKKGANLSIIREILEKRITDKQLRILDQLTENIHYIFSKNRKVAISTAYCLEYIPDISSVLSMIKVFEDVDAFFVIINTKGKITVIGRSKVEDINVGRILMNLGGGGHPYAASATVKGFTTAEVKSILENLILSNLYRDILVKEIMDQNISIYSLDTQVKDVKGEDLEKPVLFLVDKEKKFQGIVLSKVIREALRHNIKNVKLEDFIINDIYVFSPETTVGEIEHYIETTSQDIFPIVEKGYPLGMVTKNQIIIVLHGQPFFSEKDIFISRKRVKPKYLNFKNKLERFFPKELIQELKNIGKLAKELGFRAYIVGGVVRDIVLGKKNLDIDIIVEGDAPILAKEYARKNNLKVHTFEEFMTAQITLKSGLKIDFATARREIYEYPGAYPKVEKATLKEDLYRRDFTINTLAIEITEDNFGILIDFFNGLRDIKDKMIRILHQLSFVEDPIRVLRALRFAGRLGFRLGKHTEKLLKLAVEEELLKVAPTGRINLELVYTFNEEKVVEIILLMNQYKVLNQLIPEFYFDAKREELITRLRDTIISFEMFFQKKVDRVSNYLLSLMYHLPLDISYLVLDKYHFQQSKKFFEEFFEKRTIFKQIPTKNSHLYEKIKNINRDLLVFFCSYLDIETSERIITILKKEEEKKLVISGKDLQELGLKPSPIYKEIIEDVFKKYLDNEIKSKKEAVAYIKMKYLEKNMA